MEEAEIPRARARAYLLEERMTEAAERGVERGLEEVGVRKGEGSQRKGERAMGLGEVKTVREGEKKRTIAAVEGGDGG